MLRWRSRCQAGDDGDYDGALEMEIKCTVLRRWRSQAQDDDGHIISLILIACDVYPLCILFCLVRGSIIRWSLTKFQGTSVLPEYAPLRKFIVLRHHVMIGCDRLYVQIQRVQNSCTRGILRLNLTSLAYADMASEHWRPKGRTWII